MALGAKRGGAGRRRYCRCRAWSRGRPPLLTSTEAAREAAIPPYGATPEVVVVAVTVEYGAAVAARRSVGARRRRRARSRAPAREASAAAEHVAPLEDVAATEHGAALEAAAAPCKVGAHGRACSITWPLSHG
jgi:hypothetical protein